MYKCVGCDAQIPWDGKSMFSYTCGCGSTMFYDEETGHLSMPCSVALNIGGGGKALPHLNDLVGQSDYSSARKTDVIRTLREQGFIWMNECEQCKKSGTLARYEARLDRERRHEEIRKRSEREGWGLERTIKELVKADKEDISAKRTHDRTDK